MNLINRILKLGCVRVWSVPRQRSFRPGLEGLETRDLPSRAGAPVNPAHDSSQGSAHGRDPGRLQQSLEPLLEQFAQTLYGANQPSAREIKRETFIGKFSFNYTIGPPRFNDRASTIYGVTPGVTGGSNQFLKGRGQIILFPPANPNATPNYGNPYANQVTGQATLFPENYLQTGSIFILDLNGAATSEVNGLPTQLTWQYDGASGGAYTAPVGFTQSLGRVYLQWIPDPQPRPGSAGSGRVIATFVGLANLSQIVNGVAKIYS